MNGYEQPAEDKKLTVRRILADEAEAVSVLEAVFALETECFSDPWSVNALSDMLENPLSHFLAAEKDGRIIGYISSRTVLDEGEILRVAVDEAERECGVGSALLAKLLADTPGIRIWNLEVREHSIPAIALYKKFGFLPLGKRKAYYRHPTEDAVLMQMTL